MRTSILHWSVAIALVAAAPAQDPAPPPERPAAAALAGWAARWERASELWEGAGREYEELVSAALEEAVRTRQGLEAVATALLDLARPESRGSDGTPFEAAEVDPWKSEPREAGDAVRSALARAVEERARAGIEELLQGPRGPEAEAFLAEVLVLGTHHSTRRRLAALDVLGDHRTPRGKLAMLTVGRDGSDPLRGAVIEELATWPDEAVDLFLVGLLGKKFDKERDPHPFNVVLRRVRDVETPLGPRAAELLAERLRTTLLASDWREVSRSIELSRGLEPEQSVPLLLDALSAWTRREEHGGGSRRILGEVVAELSRISGRSIGRNPRNWITWWIAVRQGRTALTAPDVPDGEPRTEATFFGLRPVTDQVTFLIDSSGSMRTEWGTSEHTRYVEAIEQMMRFLQAAGEQTRFNVVLFSDSPQRSSPHLVRASAHNLMRARESLLRFEPAGGTHLRPAVELALALDPEGHVDLERLEADTVIVLCDGETQDGVDWVQPLLERVNDEARIVFHCVLIGMRDSGVLQRLAELTGGDFLRVGG